MSHCFDKDVEILNQLGLQEHAVFTALVYCLQANIYGWFNCIFENMLNKFLKLQSTENFSDDLKIVTFNGIIQIITFVANTSIGYNLIWNLFTRNEMHPLFEAMVFGLQIKNCNSNRHA